MNMKKILALLLSAVLCASALAGCAAKEKPAADAGSEKPAADAQDAATAKPTEIRLLTRWGDSNPTTLDYQFYNMVKQFQIDNPDIKIIDESISGSDDSVFFDKVKTSIAIGDAPDIIYNYGGGVNKEYVKNGVFLDLEPYFAEDPEWKASMDGLYDLWQYPDIKGTYGIPLKTFIVSLYYNQDLFDKYKLEVPKTIEEMEAVAKTFMENGVIPMVMGGKESWRCGHLGTTLTMLMVGPEKIDALGARTAKHTDKDIVEVYQQIKDWHEMGMFGENIISMDSEMEKTAFITGKSAMEMQGSWFIGSLAATEEAKTTNFGVTYFPYFADKPQFAKHTMGSSNSGLSIYASGDKAREDASVKFFKYLSDPENVKKMYADGAMEISPVKGLAPNYPDTPLYNEFKAVSTDPDVVVRQEVDCYDPLPQMVDVYRDSVQGMLVGNTAQQCAEQIQAEIDKNA